MCVRKDLYVTCVCMYVCLCVREQGMLDEWWDPENFTFTYEMKKEKYELYDEQQIL